MRRKASGFYADSLEMLLDTMCNVLGAIVFITLTLAVLAPTSRAPVQEALQRQTTELSNALATVTASNAWVQAELEQTLLRLQEPRQKFQTNRMRLPSISRRTRESWPVILRYGRVFPLYLSSSVERGGKTQNLQMIDWRRAAGGIVLVEPKRDQGDEPESGIAEMAQALGRQSKTNFYFTFLVYEDSFAAFNRAKETAASLGFQYGWEPLAQNTQLQFGGSHPENIPPQN
jgi:hypothetical protein